MFQELKMRKIISTINESNYSLYGITKVRWLIEANHRMIGRKYKLPHYLCNKLLSNAAIL
jgi:hypothetical protein